MDSSFNLKGKNVLITSAATGIGRSIAELFSKSGANIGLHFNQSEGEAKQLKKNIKSNGRVKLFSADLTNFKMTQSLINDFLGEFKSIDVLINNAGGVVGAQDFLALDIREARRFKNSARMVTPNDMPFPGP